jgi:hypothetical protein
MTMILLDSYFQRPAERARSIRMAHQFLWSFADSYGLADSHRRRRLPNSGRAASKGTNYRCEPGLLPSNLGHGSRWLRMIKVKGRFPLLGIVSGKPHALQGWDESDPDGRKGLGPFVGRREVKFS